MSATIKDKLEFTEWNRFDICEAYAVMEWDWNVNGWLRDRKTNQRRMEATSIQLARLGFKPRPDLSYQTLEENGKAIYRNLVSRYGFGEVKS